MKENITIIGMILGSMAGLVLVGYFIIGGIFFLFTDPLNLFPDCKDKVKYFLEIPRGVDKPLGEDYETALKLSNGGIVYPVTVCELLD